MQAVYILSAVRTPIGKFGGSLASLTAADMGVVAAKAAIERAGIQPEQVEETIFGNARQAGGGPNPARQISIRSGVPQEVPAFTVNKACASGMKSIALAYQSILLGDASCILAGGTESMSRVPYYLEARWGYRLGNQELVDGMYRDGFFCPLAKMVMGETAEVLAEQYKISREEQDEYALLSQTRAARAIAAGRFDAELVPVTIEGKKGATTFSRDEHPFPDASMEKLGKLAPVFSKTGTITAGNSSGITDGAAAVVVASEHFVKTEQSEAAGANLGGHFGGSRSAHDGDWARPGAAQTGRETQPQAARVRIDRTERSLRRAGAGLRPRIEFQSRPAQRERRSDRARASHRLHRHAHHGDPAARDAEAQHQARRGHALRERRHGHGAGAGERGVSAAPLIAETSFRLATESDADTLLPFMRDYYAFDGHAFDEQKARVALITLLRDPSLGRVWLILANTNEVEKTHKGKRDYKDNKTEAPVGYIVLCFGYSLEWLGRDAFVDEFYLLPRISRPELGTQDHGFRRRRRPLAQRRLRFIWK